MTSRVEVTGTLPDMTLTLPGGSITVTQWPTVTPEAGRPLWESYGVCSHPNFGKGVYADVDAWTQKLADLGAYVFRGGVAAQLDTVKRTAVRARELGLKWHGIVATEKTTDVQLQQNLAFVRANADVFISVEGVNEPDADGLFEAEVQKVAKFQQIIWEFVTANNLDMNVLSPALRRPAPEKLYQRFADVGIQRWFDTVSLHHYGRGGMIDRAELAAHIDMVQGLWQCDRFWVTETGSTNATESPDPRRCTEEASAAYSVRNIFDILEDPRVEKVFRYELLDDAGPLTNNEAHFGLWRADGTMKPEIAELITLRLSVDVDVDRGPVELEVTAPEGVRMKAVGIGLWLWRPGVAFDAEPVNVQVATPNEVRTVQVAGSAVGIPLN